MIELKGLKLVLLALSFIGFSWDLFMNLLIGI